jgi:hypothetical protein
VGQKWYQPDRYCSSDGVLDIFIYFLSATILDLAKNVLPLFEPKLLGMWKELVKC